MSDDNFGPWIDWAGGECPIPDAKAGEYDLQFTEGPASSMTKKIDAKEWDWLGIAVYAITAYRVRLPADDLLRQAIEALRETTDFMERHSNRWDGSTKHPAVVIETARAVLTAYDERGK